MTPADLTKACRARRERPPRPAQTLINAYREGLVDRGKRGKYKLNTVGENLAQARFLYEIVAGPQLSFESAYEMEAVRGHQTPASLGVAAKSSFARHRSLASLGVAAKLSIIRRPFRRQ